MGRTRGSRRAAKTEADDPRPAGLRPPPVKPGEAILLPQCHDDRWDTERVWDPGDGQG